MPQYGHNAANLVRSVNKRKLRKIKRINRGYLHREERYQLKTEEYEKYVDDFLIDGEKTYEKVKIAVQMYDKKKKYEKPEVEATIELDMEVLRKRGEETVESDEPAA